ncbi:glycosyltransferase family 4 protein [Roseomonas sp. GCM10028921]
MRIVHVVRQFRPALGGLEDSTFNLIRHQRESEGLDSQVVTLNRLFTQPCDLLPSSETVDGVPVTRIPWAGSSRYPVASTVLSHFGSADLVHVHAIDFFFDYLAATKPLHRKRLVATTHGGFFHTRFAARAKRLYFSTITRASSLAYARIVATSPSDGEAFRRIAGAKVSVIENGVDSEKFLDAASPTPSRTIIYFGRWTVHKRIEALFPVLAALRAQEPDWRLIVAGAPSDRSLADLEGAAATCGVGDAVTFHESPSEAALRAAIARATFFACASEHEGFGIAAVEAMSAGLIPLLSRIDCFANFVDRSGAGALIDFEEARPAAAAIAALARRPDVLGGGMRAKAIKEGQRYSWAAASARYAAVYAAALGRPQRLDPALTGPFEHL